jgi:hypothetical protein
MDLQNKVVGIVGRKGSGKSRIFQQILQRCPRVLVFDTMGEHGWIPNRCNSLESVGRFLGWASVQDKFAGSLIPQNEIEPAFDQIAEWTYEQGGMTLGVEEVPFLCSPSYVPPGLDRIVRLGRHRQIDLIYTGQRMAEIARRLTAATDVFVLFQHTEPRDLDAIVARCGREIADQVSELSTHGWLEWNAVSRAISKNGKLLGV